MEEKENNRNKQDTKILPVIVICLILIVGTFIVFVINEETKKNNNNNETKINISNNIDNNLEYNNNNHNELNEIYFYKIDNEYKYTKNYEDIENKNSVISTYQCKTDSCFVGSGIDGFDFSINQNNGKTIISENYEYYTLYDIKSNQELFEFGIGSNKVLCEKIYSYCENNNTKYLYVKDKNNNKYGIIDLNGNIIKDFHLNLLPINYKRNTLRDAYSIENNMLVDTKNNKYGIIEITSDNVLVDYNYEEIKLVNSNYFITKDNSLWYLYDINSKQKVFEEGYKVLLSPIDNVLIAQKDNYVYIINYNSRNYVIS